MVEWRMVKAARQTAHRSAGLKGGESRMARENGEMKKWS
jgi:hypothetical protein